MRRRGRSNGAQAPADPARRHGLAPFDWPVRLAALWVLAGAVAKALTGTPAELPAPILALEIDPFAVIAAAVVVETLVAVVALSSPRRGWWPLALLLGAFVAVLVLHMGAGGEHCGCFGGAMAIPASVMLAIDGALLVGVLGAGLAGVTTIRAGDGPARSTAMRRLALATSIGLAAGVALGWYASARLQPLRPREARLASAPAAAAPARAAPPSTSSPVLPAAAVADGAPASAPAAPWRLPDTIPDQVILRPLQWIGRRLADTELGRWTDTSAFPADATLVIYYLSCNHCAAHLRDLAARQDASPETAPSYVLVQLPTPPGYTGKLFVDRVPRGMHVVLPDQVRQYVITPPWNVVVSGGAVTGAERIKWSGEQGG